MHAHRRCCRGRHFDGGLCHVEACTSTRQRSNHRALELCVSSKQCHVAFTLGRSVDLVLCLMKPFHLLSGKAIPLDVCNARHQGGRDRLGRSLGDLHGHPSVASGKVRRSAGHLSVFPCSLSGSLQSEGALLLDIHSGNDGSDGRCCQWNANVGAAEGAGLDGIVLKSDEITILGTLGPLVEGKRIGSRRHS